MVAIGHDVCRFMCRARGLYRAGRRERQDRIKQSLEFGRRERPSEESRQVSRHTPFGRGVVLAAQLAPSHSKSGINEDGEPCSQPPPGSCSRHFLSNRWNEFDGRL